MIDWKLSVSKIDKAFVKKIVNLSGSFSWKSNSNLNTFQFKPKIINIKSSAYPNLSTAIGGDEGGVCIGPAIVVMANGDGQWCCCCVCCWWPAVSPLILSGGVSVPGIIPLPTSSRLNWKVLISSWNYDFVFYQLLV